MRMTNTYRLIQPALRMCTLLLLLCILAPQRAYPQLRSGAAFLKILPGVRTQGLAGSVTGSIDEALSLYANPGAAGFLREHQWSLSYTKWIADIYNISFLYGRHFKTPLNKRTRFALGINYQGVKEFDSTINTMAPAAP